MGIWREVKVKTCGNVAVSHSTVRSRVSTSLDEAWLTIATELWNLSDQPVEGIICGTADGQDFECPITLKASEKCRYTLPKELHISQPACGGVITWVSPNSATCTWSLSK